MSQIFKRIAFRRRTLEEELQEVGKQGGAAAWKCCPRASLRRPAHLSAQALLRGSLRKAFGGFDLLCLGLGIVIGSGWAQLTGNAAQQYAG